MIFGKKSDLKSHLSMKRPSWTHKVVAHNAAHEENPEMERQEASPQEREPLQPRY
jgi:hypothetical protein